MNKEKITEKVAQLREPEVKAITDLPTNSGRYNVQIAGVRTIAPLFLNFDGKEWIGLNELLSLADGEVKKISYYDKEITKKIKP